MGKLKFLEHVEVYRDHHYNTFPSILKRSDGMLVAGFRQATDRQFAYGSVTHIDPTSKAVYVTSRDGKTWNRQPGIIYDDFLHGVQDPCLNILSDGTLFVTFFMWKVFEAAAVAERKPDDILQYGRWLARLDNVYSIRSADGGQSWDEPIALPFYPVALRGNCTELADGSIVAPLYGKEDGTYNVIIVRTEDRGQTWARLATIPGCDGYDFEEPHLYRTASGKLVAFIRTWKKEGEPGRETDRMPLYTAESLDDGKTWSRPVKREFYSPSPFHVVRLASGNVLLSYGCRHKPYGIRAAILDAECVNWDEVQEVVLRDDGLGFDLGYTSAVQMDDGRILITYYYCDQENGERYIAGTLCRES